MLHLEDSVSETLLIPLYMKHLASQMPNPVIHDEAATRLVRQLDYDFSKYDHIIHTVVGTAIRADYFDRLTADFIHRRPNPVVVNVGCGLDSRRERIGAAADGVPFYDIDLPDVIALRQKLLPAQRGETLLATSAFDAGWMDELNRLHPNAQFLLVIEGVLMYFDRYTVRALFCDLARRFHRSEVAFDVQNSWMVKNSDRHEALKHVRARFVFGCDDDLEFERWADNLHLMSVKRLTVDFPQWKRSGFLLSLIGRQIPAFRDSTRMLHYRLD